MGLEGPTPTFDVSAHAVYQHHSLYASAVESVQWSIGNSTIWCAATQKPINWSIHNLAETTTSGKPLNTPNGISIGSGAWAPGRADMLLYFYFLRVLRVKPLDRFWRIISHITCFCEYCITGLERHRNFAKSKSQKMLKIPINGRNYA